MKSGLRLFGHPVHPMLSDFPVALLVLAPVADLVGFLRGAPLFWQMGYWGIAVGLVAAIPTAVSGFLDFSRIPEEHPASNVGMWHMGLMLSAVSASGVALALRREPTPPEAHQVLALALELFGATLIGVGGWFGGHMVLRHGIGSIDESHAGASQSPPSERE